MQKLRDISLMNKFFPFFLLYLLSRHILTVRLLLNDLWSLQSYFNLYPLLFVIFHINITISQTPLTTALGLH
jgi:hypothetical protein